jgi:dTDP-3-amino-3,4,6-trideoxy-alpha-D-glucose transaminase
MRPLLSSAPALEAVPFLDLRPIHQPLKAELVKDFDELIDSGAFANGSPIDEFETAFAEFCSTRFCVGMASGLDALRLALLSSGIEEGDEVVVPANTFVATLEAVTQAGGKPVVADVSDIDYNLDPDAVEAAIGPRTRFIIPVHLYGQMADMAGLSTIAEKHGLVLIEDACQAHGASRDGIRAGSAGRASAFSFYPAKNLGAMGDAGALVTSSEPLRAHAVALREHGQRSKYDHFASGYTARLDTIQALVLLRKLPMLDEWNRQRAEAAAVYSDELEGVGDLILPTVPPSSSPSWHLYVVRTKDPIAFGDFLAENDIGTGRHYPEPVHLTDAWSNLGYRPGAFPVAERLAREVISLPMFPGITEDQLHAVVTVVGRFFARG